MSNIRKPYEPPTLTKRGNLKFLTQSTLPSGGIQEDPPTGDLTGDGLLETAIDSNNDGFIDFVEIGGSDKIVKTIKIETGLSLGDVAYYDSWLRESDPVPGPNGVLFDFAVKDGNLYYDKVPGEDNVAEGPTAGGKDPWDIEDEKDNRK